VLSRQHAERYLKNRRNPADCTRLRIRGAIINDSDDTTRYRFGEYVLDVAAGLVWQGDRRVELRPQTFAVLEYLVRHGGELVGKEDLLKAVWGDRVVTDDSVTRCISEIRSALGEPGQGQLQTVPRRGYRLEVPVIEFPDAQQTQTEAEPTKRRDSYRVALLGVLAVLALSLLLVRDQAGPGSGPPAGATSAGASNAPVQPPRPNIPGTEDPRPSLAVLPFVYRGLDADRSFLADGFHDDLLTALAQSDNLRVISRTSVMPYAGTTRPIPEIGRELGVDHVLEGSVEVQGDSIRIHAQLIQAESDSHLWARSFDRFLEPGQLFSLRNELSEVISSDLEARLDVQPPVPTNSVMALEAYHRGRQALFRGSVEQLKFALEQFELAVEADPGYADAWVGIADAWTVLAEVGAQPRWETWRPREQAIERALALDPDQASAHAARGWLHYHRVGGGNPEEPALAEAAFQKAITLNPNDARAHMGYALLLNLAFPERLADSIELLEKARRLDPRSSTVVINLAATYRFWGVFDPAERLLLDAAEWEITKTGSRRVLARLYLDWGRLADARTQAEAAVAIDDQDIAVWSLLGETALELRDFERAKEVRDALRTLAPSHPETLVLETKILDRAGDRVGVRAVLEEALERFGPDPGLLAFGDFMFLLQGDLDSAARWQAMIPEVNDETAWPNLIRLQADFACVMGWLGTRYDEPELGPQLVAEAARYIVETLPASRDHVDRYKPDICHLAAGEPEQAIESIEQQAAHRHIALWDEWHRLPLYDAIRDDPRYRSAWALREKLLLEERRLAGLIEQTARENSPGPNALTGRPDR
jgi:TolB-like protein/DNA-binding winged helix-turn-helix (wHTH) protein/Flp pilus assembly protein TadD